MKSIRILSLSIFLCIISLGFVIPESKAGSNCAKSIPELFKQVSPSVVFISAASIDPFKVINRVKSAIGSGLIFSKDGLILTNSHVVFGQQLLIATLDDGNKVEAKIVGIDPLLDLAVLRIPLPPEGLPIATFGDSDAIQIGEEVLVIGNPLGLEQTITRGIVSGVNRIVPSSPLGVNVPLIQTDAAINLGNSGGPLINLCGEVIGINSAKIIGAQSIGFAVPINIAKEVIPQLVEKGRVIRPWVGVHGKPIKKEDLAIINVPLADGFLVEAVEPGSPADRAGIHGGMFPITIKGREYLLGGDVITELNGQSLDDQEKLMKLVRSLKVGDKVSLILFRDMKTRSVEFHLPERPILPGDLPPDIPRSSLPVR
jgi:S1-C subfamily serine protease